MKKTTLLSLLVVTLYNLFFFGQRLELGFFVFNLLMAGFLILTREKNNPLSLFFLTVFAVFSFFYALFANPFVKFLDTLVSLFAFSWALFFSLSPALQLEISNLLSSPFILMKEYLLTFISLFWEKETSENRFWKGAKIFLGNFLISLPLLLLLLFLFVLADPIFSFYVKKIFESFFQIFNNNFLPRLIQSFFLFLFLELTASLPKNRKVAGQKNFFEKKEEFFSQITFLLTGVFLLLASFIFVQIKYLFQMIPEKELIKFGINTYSEYTRRGFLELIIAALICYLFVFVSVKIKEAQKKKHAFFLSFLNLGIIGEIFLLIFSSAKRVYLYGKDHGLTEIRVFGSIFLVHLSFILLFLLWRNFSGRKKILWLELLTTLMMLGIANFLNVDKLIAENFPPTVNYELDTVYLAKLSSDAPSGWLLALRENKRVLTFLQKQEKLETDDYRKLYYATLSLEKIKENLDFLEKNFRGGKIFWPSLNFSEEWAWELVRKSPEFSKVEELLKTAEALQKKVGEKTIQETNFDRSLSHPLID